MVYLKNAPKALIGLYEKRLATDGSIVDGSFVPLNRYRPPRKHGFPLNSVDLLEQLLTNQRMKRHWAKLQKYLNRRTGSEKFYSAIIKSMGVARRGLVSREQRRERLQDIARLANRLARMIAEPQHVAPDGSAALYRGELDLQAYELLPPNVASILGADKYQTMNAEQRSEWAYSVLREWPTMVEMLHQLATRARQIHDQAVHGGRRSRGPEDDKLMMTKARLFSCALDQHLQSFDRKFNAFASICVITAFAYGVEVSRNILRQWIIDDRKKRHVKRGSKSAVKKSI